MRGSNREGVIQSISDSMPKLARGVASPSTPKPVLTGVKTGQRGVGSLKKIKIPVLKTGKTGKFFYRKTDIKTGITLSKIQITVFGTAKTNKRKVVPPKIPNTSFVNWNNW